MPFLLQLHRRALPRAPLALPRHVFLAAMVQTPLAGLLLVFLGIYVLRGNSGIAGMQQVQVKSKVAPHADGPVENPDYPVAQPGATSNIQDLSAFAKNLWAKYQQRLHGPTASNSTIAYHCGPNDLCGGWGDRLRGMATLFYYALLTDSQFDIVNTKPLDLATVYPLIGKRRPTYSMDGAVSAAYIDLDPAFLINPEFGADVATHPAHAIRSNTYGWYYLRKNPRLAEVVDYYGLARLTTLDLFRVMMELYFSKTSLELQQLVDTELTQMSTDTQERTTRIGVQIRNGGSWGDAIRHATQSATQFANQALLTCKQADDKCWIYVTSDSVPAQELFVQHIRQQQPQTHITVASGNPVHVDRSSIDLSNNAALLKSYVDWELLRHMDHLVISRSGFGETAAWASIIPSERLNPGEKGEGGSFVVYDSVIGPPVGVHP